MARRSELTDEDRFWSKVDRSSGADACWPWTGAKSKRGYGAFRLGGSRRMVGAHRFALEIGNGVVLVNGMQSCHRCDNPPCCNPAHLFAGTQRDNHSDMCMKNRQARAERSGIRRHPERYSVGAQHPRAKLSHEAALAIIHACRDGALQSDLARQHGISISQVNDIALGKSWRHITRTVHASQHQ